MPQAAKPHIALITETKLPEKNKYQRIRWIWKTEKTEQEEEKASL